MNCLPLTDEERVHKMPLLLWRGFCPLSRPIVLWQPHSSTAAPGFTFRGSRKLQCLKMLSIAITLVLHYMVLLCSCIKCVMASTFIISLLSMTTSWLDWSHLSTRTPYQGVLDSFYICPRYSFLASLLFCTHSYGKGEGEDSWRKMTEVREKCKESEQTGRKYWCKRRTQLVKNK